MKSILISFMMFAVALGAMYLGLFEALSSSAMYLAAGIILLVVLLLALKVLGLPFTKDSGHGKKKR